VVEEEKERRKKSNNKSKKEGDQTFFHSPTHSPLPPVPFAQGIRALIFPYLDTFIMFRQHRIIARLYIA
jgi:hypothetical protein